MIYMTPVIYLYDLTIQTMGVCLITTTATNPGVFYFTGNTTDRRLFISVKNTYNGNINFTGMVFEVGYAYYS